MKLAYTVREAIREIGISRTKFYREIADGKIKPRKIGKKTIILAEDIDSYLQSLPTMEASDATPANNLINVKEACDRSGEKPATIINWCVRHKIGDHVKTGSGGAWMVDPDRLERLLAERGAAA